ncbi:MAG TPA: hypothetical protein PLF01_02895, partial [Alphaproteobacteria bacterium]|nr:hypothetical protein [Alphaproteobacteria bacterium]
REGFEEYMSNASGTNATIGHVEKISFFPNVDISIKDATMHDTDNAAIIKMEIKSAEFSSPFWSMFGGSNRINNLSINQLKAVEEQITPLAITLDSVKIEDKQGPEQYGSFLIMSGEYGGKKLYIEAELEKINSGYKIPKEVPFSIQLGQSALNASFLKGFSMLTMKSAVFSKNGRQSPAEDYILVKSGEYNKSNPLSCLFYNGDAKECDIYLDGKGSEAQ